MTHFPTSATRLQIESYEERAAIKEYLGNLSREQAEKEVTSFMDRLQKES